MHGFLNQEKIYYKNILNLYELSTSLIKLNDNDLISENEFLSKLINLCECAVKLNCSIILTWIFRSIAKKVSLLKCLDKIILLDVILKDDLSLKTVESLNTLSNRLFDLNKVFYLCQIGTSSLNSYLNFDFNLKNILQRGKGIISEIIGKHIIHNKYPPVLLTLIESENDATQLDVLNSNLLYKEFYGK